jgi:hypothetical protein
MFAGEYDTYKELTGCMHSIHIILKPQFEFAANWKHEDYVVGIMMAQTKTRYATFPCT